VTKVFTALLLADMAERREVRLSDPAARYLLALAAGSDYETLVTTRVCGPLGLADTTFGVPGPSRDRKAQGHKGGRPVPDWRMGALAGAGALYSTAADLARFLQACLAASSGSAPDGALASAIRATLTPHQPIPGGEIGLAWHHTRRGDHSIIWHNGMTGGFSAMIAFEPVRNLGVAALANTAGSLPSPLDQAVLSAFGS
jgi:CubicO group peptidase (beta-lactamase class C family)